MRSAIDGIGGVIVTRVVSGYDGAVTGEELATPGVPKGDRPIPGPREFWIFSRPHSILSWF